MSSQNCCRTCLSVETLNPIFVVEEHSVTYTEIITLVTGVKIEMNDSLPQVMCTACISFINETIKFRKKCEESQKALENGLNGNVGLKKEFKSEFFRVEIDITDYVKDDGFNDHDDNITLDMFQDEKERSVQEIVNKEVTDLQRKSKPTVKWRVKKENVKIDKDKCKDKVRESIECEYCHKVLTSKTSMRNHYKIHTGFDVVCEHCGKKFITRRLLLMHCRAKHGYEKTDKCSYCDYRASNAEQVKIHERLHTGEKPYVCKDCNAGFHRKSSYLQHIAIHLPEKTVQCDQCPARFKSVTLMRIHKNRHRAPQYTFSCRVCQNTFARRRNVARHLQRIHGLAPADHHIQRAHKT